MGRKYPRIEVFRAGLYGRDRSMLITSLCNVSLKAHAANTAVLKRWIGGLNCSLIRLGCSRLGTPIGPKGKVLVERIPREQDYADFWIDIFDRPIEGIGRQGSPVIDEALSANGHNPLRPRSNAPALVRFPHIGEGYSAKRLRGPDDLVVSFQRQGMWASRPYRRCSTSESVG
jgi:hypothetical protein